MQKIRLKSQKLKRFQDLKILSNCDFAQLRLTKIAVTYSILKLKISIFARLLLFDCLTNHNLQL